MNFHLSQYATNVDISHTFMFFQIIFLFESTKNTFDEEINSHIFKPGVKSPLLYLLRMSLWLSESSLIQKVVTRSTAVAE